MFFQIQAINNEQDAFGKDITAYPERQQIINTLNPYLKLYETTVEFQEKHKWVFASCFLHHIITQTLASDFPRNRS